MDISKARSYKEEEENKSFRVAELFLLLSSTMKTLVLIALVGCSLGILMQAVVAEEPFETAENPEGEEESYERYEDTNAPDFSDSDEGEKGRYEERMNTPGDSDDDHKEEKERNEQRMIMNDVTNGEDEVLEKPEDAVDDPDSVNSVPADPAKWGKRRRRRRQYNYNYGRSRRGWGKK